MKICTRCLVKKQLTEFGKMASRPDGLNYWCRVCVREHSERVRRARGVKPRARIRRPGKKLCYKCKRWLPLRLFWRDKRTLDGHTAACSCCGKSIKAHYNSTPDSARVRQARRRVRRAVDIGYVILERLRGRIRQALHKTKKSAVSRVLLGCTIEEFRRYLEQRFEPGMSWQNYGLHGWHIGHVVDCCAFDLTKPAEQRKAFHYSNMRPQWAQDNWAKKRDNRNKIK